MQQAQHNIILMFWCLCEPEQIWSAVISTLRLPRCLFTSLKALAHRNDEVSGLRKEIARSAVQTGYYLGTDIGSVNANLALVDESGRVVEFDY